MADNVVAIRRNYDTEARREAAKAGKQGRMSLRARRACALLIAREVTTVKAAAEAVGMNPDALSRALHKPQAADQINEMTRHALTLGQMVAAGAAIDIAQNGESEHARLDAAKMLLGIAGHAIERGSGVSVTINNTPGYVLDLSDRPPTLDVTPSIDEDSAA